MLDIAETTRERAVDDVDDDDGLRGMSVFTITVTSTNEDIYLLNSFCQATNSH